MKINSVIKQIHVYFRKIPFHPNKMPPASFGCWVYRIAMQIHQQYQFHVVSFTCIIQEDLRLPVLCIVTFSAPNKKHQWKPYLCQKDHSWESNFEKMLFHAELIEVPSLKHSSNQTCLQLSYTNTLGWICPNWLSLTMCDLFWFGSLVCWVFFVVLVFCFGFF